MSSARCRRASLVVPLIACCTLATPTMAASASGPVAPCALSELPGLAAQFARARRAAAASGPAGAAGIEAAVAAEFWRVARAVVGPVADTIAAAPDAPVGGPPVALVPCDPAVRARDAAAWRFGLAGYSAREIADVLEGHLTPADLDQAQALLMAGQADTRVAEFLEARWRERAPVVSVGPLVPLVPRPETTPARVAALDADLTTLAHRHRVPPGLIRAVIAAESAGNPRALSAAGAIGLMQLMPGTARALGVNPWDPRDNLRGGIAYLGSLMRTFGESPRLALIAYNAGPGHAHDVQAGRAVAYRETRHYLAAIGARYPLP